MDTNLIIRIVVLVAVLVNQVLVAVGKNPLPFADETIYELASVIVTVTVTVYNAWKNNNVTNFAKIAQKVLDALKKGQITIEAVETLLSENTEDEVDYEGESEVE
jgi:SPP1 family holin